MNTADIPIVLVCLFVRLSDVFGPEVEIWSTSELWKPTRNYAASYHATALSNCCTFFGAGV